MLLMGRSPSDEENGIFEVEGFFSHVFLFSNDLMNNHLIWIFRFT